MDEKYLSVTQPKANRITAVTTLSSSTNIFSTMLEATIFPELDSFFPFEILAEKY